MNYNTHERLREGKSEGYQEWRRQTERLLQEAIALNNTFNELEEALQDGVQKASEAKGGQIIEAARAQVEHIRKIGVEKEAAFHALVDLMEDIRDNGTEMLHIISRI